MKVRHDMEVDARYIRLREAEHGMIFTASQRLCGRKGLGIPINPFT
jgi:hypothetical protein